MNKIFKPLVLPVSGVDRIISRTQYILERAKGKEVLHVGCSDWPITAERVEKNELLHTEITKASSDCTGIDIEKKGIEILKKNGINNVLLMNAESPDKELFEKFSVVVAGEVLEHVDNAGMFLAGLRKTLTSNGTLIITVPNAFFILRYLKLFIGKETVHKDHVYYFSAKTLTCLLRRYGFEVVEIGYTMDALGDKQKSLFKKILSFPLSLMYKKYPMIGNSLVVCCKKEEDIKVKDEYLVIK